MLIKEYIYIPFNKTALNYLNAMEVISVNMFDVETHLSSDHKSLKIKSDNLNLVSIIINPVYAIITKMTENDLAKEIYDALTIKTKSFCG
ncbi:hypothetical protein [Pedobacter mendelii]|uniref:Uncharacterized protein n=1 Tax=Pedobacter mendelii TaxID=1908240 RepID=A0ABQ2BNV0_9SPHI|nr:hypothetical protein [Pedobacter mendelii]GGI29105.1 hypothetical protein GCM10008119_35970 [Pedobacter mendelii]